MRRARQAAWCVVWIVGCAGPRQDEPPAGPIAAPDSGAGAEGVGVETGPTPLASAPAAEPDAGANEEGLAPAPVRRPRVSTSPGQIECETVVCDLATEMCCADSQRSGRCIPRDAPNGCESLELLWKSCDEVDDCGAGKVCCYSPRPDPTVYAQNVCRTACEDPELETCLAGGKCAGNQRCKLIDESQYDGYCAK